MTQHLSKAFQLHDALFALEEFTLDIINAEPYSASNMPLLTAAIPQHAPGVSGLVGMAFAPGKKITAHEDSIIHSILAVLVMVVGSSKALSRTLSELQYAALHDPLTDLYNRRHFKRMLEHEIKCSERNDKGFSLLLLDIDNFKNINDTYGHSIGDQALRSLGGILLNHSRKNDLATRIGGDEFGIILTESGRTGAARVANSVRAKLKELIFTSSEDKPFHITVSIGIVTYPHDGGNAHDLLASADLAMHSVKKNGKDAICSFHQVTDRTQLKRNNPDKAESLRVAMREDRFLLYFQPIIDCQTGAIFGYEALARLKDPNGNIIWADSFIETIERYGLACEFDRTIINKAFEIQSTCGVANCKLVKPKMFINLSAQEIESGGILGYAEELGEHMRIPPSSIVFEITELDAIKNIKEMRRFINRLRDKGFGFALNDFGSDHNSFHYLRELRFEYAKIDGAYVRNMLNSKIDYARVHNLFNLCRDLDIGVIAEYVENKEIYETLRDMGVDYAQGFYLGMPHPKIDCRMYYPPSWNAESSDYHKCPISLEIEKI
ncbi:bifunctional diguanylate cyclase/phosphodiesterase [Methylomicrobium sp. Wu6]|uniref:putative bifunctional diguanylate cyclase/phosphodiesterase n=1 Tax=Methylomicrobium sp. Wu6 TaxID=3107928 RepID=UPI002DD62A47|nr:bifunctional diguanylate cyclase/phosphodiesterase [Methylomicrobium sp. Wu6]MEC4748235.1 bifunctional diguanylate cyclase/phosphodiesterase [Methylomicrobium sp. Wu6]